jgi:hypothetical protein
MADNTAEVFKGLPRNEGFHSTAFFLKQAERDVNQAKQVPPVVLIYLDAPPSFRNRLYAAFGTTTKNSRKAIEDVISDPYRIFLVIIMAWYSWNSDLFWALRDNMLALEAANSKDDISATPEYAYMHLLSKDMIQAIELFEFAIKVIVQM